MEKGREALAAIGDGQYDGVLMDCQMPVMDDYLSKPVTSSALEATPERWARSVDILAGES